MIRLSSLSLILPILCGLLCFSPPSFGEPWQEIARHVGPAEGDRQEHIDQLKKLENLDKVVIDAIGTKDQALALDTISALKLKHLVPELLESIDRDDTGFLILTISVFINKSNYAKIFQTYKNRLANSTQQSPANLVAFLEPLGRLGEPLPTKTLQKLIRHHFPEVRSATLDYSRKMMFRYYNQKYHSIIKMAAADRTYQIRQQIESYLIELESNPKARKAISAKSFFKLAAKRPSFKIKENDLRVVFGYKDARPGRFVGDRHERLAMVQHLLEPCKSSDRQTCGFRRHSKDANLLLKKVTVPGNKVPLKLHLRIVHSSASTDDQENRINPYQKVLSANAEDVFLTGLREADLVFYNVHSRFGGGPDFTPPLLNTSNYVDSVFYRTYTSGLTRMMSALEERALDKQVGQIDLFGMFSCASTQHFKKALKEKGIPKFITSKRLLHYAEALRRTEKQLNLYLKNLIDQKASPNQIVSN